MQNEIEKNNNGENRTGNIFRLVKCQMSNVKCNGGFSIIEILIAASIILFSIFAILSLAQKSVQVSRLSLYQTQASFLLEEGAEATKTIRDAGWTNISSLTSGTTYYLSFSGTAWSLSATPATVGIFTRTVLFSDVYRDVNDDIATSGTLDSGTKKVTITVSWRDTSGSTSKSISLYMANIL